ncbi:hypothetical protein [Burkholderia sp. Ac-20353]|uniref:hypothetical protein n=1 Tax=Burkholderia sp. Ac-20353 TaxID=2703894 RepID=UPI00197B1E1B|nr:hypothetical protein [Burkholderia sp. Ac-20353]MBN3792718.1 hypothetical protein [Burkholderia sp. Ac-20353]
MMASVGVMPELELLVRQGSIQPLKPHAAFVRGTGHGGVRRVGIDTLLGTGSITPDETRKTFVVTKVSTTAGRIQIV